MAHQILRKKHAIVAVCQMKSGNNKPKNLKIVKTMVMKAKKLSADMVFLPEGCDFIAEDGEETVGLAEEITGTIMNSYRELAKVNNIWISIGGFHERVFEKNEYKVYNSHFIIDNEGAIKTRYRKLHLFDVNLPKKNITIKESDTVNAGSAIIEPIETPVGRIGLAICYDLRFPEMSCLLRSRGATVLTYPSAFTKATGKLHWEVLLRARAIENQCYVFAPAQVGSHNLKRISYGQAMIVNPLGTVVAQCPTIDNAMEDGEVIVAAVENESLETIRQEMPVYTHRRRDLYSLIGTIERCDEIDIISDRPFATNIVPATMIFFESKYTFAFTNIRCVVPGHVLVASKRVIPKLQDLDDCETSDLFQTVIKVEKVVQEAYNATCSTIVVQDGEAAGQTVKHVHVHVLPRKTGDFESNDDVYTALATHDNPQSTAIRRGSLEMSTEAAMLRAIFAKYL